MADLFSQPPRRPAPPAQPQDRDDPSDPPALPALGRHRAYLDGLNPVQREAVEAVDGPVLVLAGAGTGKTRVLTTRLVHILLTRRANPWQILTVTFTNKAAKEMRQRVDNLLGSQSEGWWMGTFHALAARILRRHAELVGLHPNFTILDTDDQLRLLKQLMEAENIDNKKWPARVLLSAIERWKDRALTPDRLKSQDAGDMANGRLLELYRQYQDRLRTLNACDFGDLLLHNITLFQQHPDVLAEYHRRFQYILVDEYQDTNVAQYLWLRLLAQANKNICCVGDDDQCLAEGTLVRMADGRDKRIEEVRIGDAVLSAQGGGMVGPSFVMRTHRKDHPGPLVEITLTDGSVLRSTPEHRHFAGYRLGSAPQHYRPQSHTGRRRNITVTLCGERRGASPLHRISVIGSDPQDAERLRAIGLSVRPVKKGNPGWRYETAMADLGALMATVDRIRDAFDGDVALLQLARFGQGGAAADAERPDPAEEGEVLTAPPAVKVRSSLPMMPAASVRTGMSMFRPDGTLVAVQSVREVVGGGAVYDLDISRTHNFIANGVVTHNSIYGWRGAEVGNILRFEQDFPGAKVIRLEQNYRSTAHILGAAHGIIANNHGRLGKQLWTEVDGGEKVKVRGLWDAEEEARWVGDEIEALQRRGVKLSEIAVLVRAGFQTREFEERFITLGLPYRVVGGPRFYERQEIRDALAYLRVVAQPNDDLAFERIINTPKRGIGPATVQQLYTAGRALGVPLTEAAWRLTETDELKPKVRATLRALMGDIARWQNQIDSTDHTDLAQAILDESGYTRMWQEDKTPEAPGRLENLKELINAMGEFADLAGFLEHVALVMENADSSGAEQVSLMTLHGAKGLEFDVVFLPGWEEGVFPSQRTLDENGVAGLEEERRLAYVGITRGRRLVHISHAANRRIHGSWASSIASRFVEELPPEHIVVENNPGIGGAGFGGGSGFGEGFGGYGGAGWGNAGFGERFNRMGRAAAQAPPRIIEGTAHVVPPRASPDRPFNPGDRVFHQKFGYGTVRTVEADKLDIRFDSAGDKKVIDRFVVPADRAG